MNTRTGGFIMALLSLAVAASAQVKTITVSAGGVLCLSCVHRVEKAIQRVEGVAKVKVRMEPVRAEVTPRAGAWVEPERLRDAIKNAGFKPGDIRCTVSGPLIAWRGQPALRVAGSDRLVVLQPAPQSPEAFAQAQWALASAGSPTVEVEGEYAGRAVPNDPAAPLALRASHVEISPRPH
jgi:Cu+-exporting ATPase